MKSSAAPFFRRPGFAIGGALLAMFGVAAGVTHLVHRDLEQQSRLINLSCRGPAGTGPDSLLVGFVISERSQTVVFRAQRAAPLPAAASDPGLLLRIVRNADGVDVGRNERWQVPANERLQGDLKVFAPADPRHAACVLTLPPGGYSALVEDRAPGGRGLVSVEVFVIRP